MSDTPKTDAVASDGWSGDAVCVPFDFAREQERAIAAKDAEIAQLRKQLAESEKNYRWIETTALADLGKENERLRERLERFEPQPISTAPSDGRKALVYRPLAHLSLDRHWDVKRLIGGNNHCWECTVPPGQQPCNPTDGACHVTHWMPLPEVTP